MRWGRVRARIAAWWQGPLGALGLGLVRDGPYLAWGTDSPLRPWVPYLVQVGLCHVWNRYACWRWGHQWQVDGAQVTYAAQPAPGIRLREAYRRVCLACGQQEWCVRLHLEPAPPMARGQP